MSHIKRHARDRLLEALNVSPIVFLNGPRQAGKSTLVQSIAKKDYPAEYVTFDSTTQKNRSFDTIINDGGKQTLMSLTADEVKGIVDSFATRIQAGWFNPYPCA